MTKKVKINIFGTDYIITTEGDPKYLKELAKALDDSIREFIGESSASLPEALVVLSLSYIDSCKIAQDNSDNLRKQVAEYLEEAAAAKLELTRARAEIERLNKNQQMKIDEHND